MPAAELNTLHKIWELERTQLLTSNFGQCYDKIPVTFVDTIMYDDPITRPTFEYVIQLPCENNPQNVIALDPDTDQYFVITAQPNKKDPPLLLEPTQTQTAFSLNAFTAQDAGI